MRIPERLRPGPNLPPRVSPIDNMRNLPVQACGCQACGCAFSLADAFVPTWRNGTVRTTPLRPGLRWRENTRRADALDNVTDSYSRKRLMSAIHTLRTKHQQPHDL